VIPILASMLVGVAAKLGIGAVASVAKRIFSSRSPSSDPSVADSNEPRRPFAEELERARGADTGPAIALMPVAAPGRVAAPPTLAAPPGAGAPPLRIEAPKLANDPARMTIMARAGRRRPSAFGQRMGRHHVGAYRRMDLGPR
jgi:hypothetical protein